MTTFEGLVSIAQTILRVPGEWHQGATAYADISKRYARSLALK